MDQLDLLKKIHNQKCALILGPMVCLTSDRRSTFSEKIAKDLTGDKQPFKHYNKDDLYYIPTKGDRTRACEHIQEEMTKAASDLGNPGFFSDHYQIFTELPFHLILSLSPDKFLYEWMRYKGVTAQFSSFSSNGEPEKFEKPDRDRPLIFNLFGEAKRAESLILTQEDFYRYLEAVFTNRKKLEELRTSLSDINYLLFLGCPLDRWYVKLVMLLFEINSDSRFISLATNPWLDLPNSKAKTDDDDLLELQDFCQRHFKITFANGNFMTFINELHQIAKQESAKPNPQISLRPLNHRLVDPIRQKNSVSIVYAIEPKSIEIVDKLTARLKKMNQLDILDEKIADSYKSNITERIQALGTNEAVITIISDKFLKERKCMDVAVKMSNANKDIASRIFPIVLSDAGIYKPVERVTYLNYWSKEVKEVEAAIRRLDDQTYAPSMQRELDQCSEIRRIVDGFVDTIGSMNALSPEIHLDENFDSLVTSLEKQFNAIQNKQG